jgi:nitrite reductase/ring-hydroxylating ferredoxin subunit
MATEKVGTMADFEQSGRVSAEIDGRSVTAFRCGDSFVAYENVCPHLGGPVCEGRIARKIDVEIAADGEAVEHFSSDTFHLVCPWHGYEFDLSTGVGYADSRFALRSFPVEERDDGIYVVV